MDKGMIKIQDQEDNFITLNLDMELLDDQRATLRKVMDVAQLQPDELERLNGINNLLDSISDCHNGYGALWANHSKGDRRECSG